MTKTIHLDDPERPTLRVIERTYITDHDGQMCVEVAATIQRPRPVRHGGYAWCDTGGGLVDRRSH